MPGWSYNYRVQAVNIIGSGHFSSVLTTTASAIPGIITTL